MVKVTPKLYFYWLCGQIKTPGESSRWDLLSEIHNKPFAWSVPNDDNRVSDAIELRREFFKEMLPEAQDTTPVASVLEVIVALSRRLSFNGDGPADKWAWQLIANLELHKRKFLDPLTPRKQDEISDILDRMIWRTYEPSGQGGLFPLAFPRQDQTQVELWYQMNAYILEQSPDYD